MSEKGISQFRSAIRAEVRRLWNGFSTAFSFVDGMTNVITIFYREAWLAGARECGITESDLTNAERRKLKEMTNSQFLYLFGFADSIAGNDRASGSPLQPHLNRAEQWINRYNEVRAVGNEMACGDEKTEWIWDPLKDHC